MTLRFPIGARVKLAHDILFAFSNRRRAKGALCFTRAAHDAEHYRVEFDGEPDEHFVVHDSELVAA